MASNNCAWLIFLAAAALFLVSGASGTDIFLEWNVAFDSTVKPVNVDQPVITINGMFPGPLINATTNDLVHVNIFNNLDEPLLMTWNGIQQRLNSWQDGVSGTNCPIEPGSNWTYVFQVKDQIGSYFYFPTTSFQKAAGGFGPIRVNNRNVILVPFPKPEAEFDLLIGDWYHYSYKDSRKFAKNYDGIGFPPHMLMNGKSPYAWGLAYESFNFTQGKTYRFRLSNVGTSLSINFRIQNHTMVVVETEGSYTDQITVDSLDIHVGQSFSVLVTANQNVGDYFIVATPTQVQAQSQGTIGIALLHYDGSTTTPNLPLPAGPDPLDRSFSVDQARSIRWNMTAGAARPNPQGTFNVTNVTISQTFVLSASKEKLYGYKNVYAINNVSYLTPETPLKLADHYLNGSGVYWLDDFPVNSVDPVTSINTSVVSGTHKGWVEIVFQNGLEAMDSWHLDGFSFYVVGFGDGEWNLSSRSSYNLLDPVVRSTTQVYPGGWSAVYAFLDNPGMWNLRSQNLQNWYLGEELYIRVHDPDRSPLKERQPPQNLLLCGKFGTSAPAPSPQAAW